MTDVLQPTSADDLELSAQRASELPTQGPLQLKGDGPFLVEVRVEGSMTVFSSIGESVQYTSIEWTRPASDMTNNWWIAFHFSHSGRPIEKLISSSSGLEMYPVLRFPILPSVFPLQLVECSCEPGSYDFSVSFANGEKIDPVIVVSIPPTDLSLT